MMATLCPGFAAATLVLIGLSGCGQSPPPDTSNSRMNVSYRVVDDDVPADSSIDVLVAPFREELVAKTSEVIGMAAGDFVKADPEGSLDNLVADAMLWGARNVDDQPISFSMANDGGLRAPINSGPISLSEIFELMPFENRIAVVELSGFQVDSLAQQIARTDGEPVSGITMRLAGTPPVAVTVRVGGVALVPEQRYRVAVSDYLANGGGSWPQLWTPLARTDLDLLIRDAIELYVRDRGTITPLLDQRIRIEGGNR